MDALYQNHQIRELEQLAAKSGIDAYELMVRAGEAALKSLIKHWPTLKEITVCCGKGNNGGDGLVIACLAHQKGFKVTVYSLAQQPTDYRGPAAQAAQACEKQGISIQPFPAPLSFEGG
ncbi:NAD(P)H-hydrate epimerase [Coxiella-like endosymbiont of Rhipicephalus sanguineus]|uniref:NAD(P)H-hydrate epimerase n=1 Tax=Coxiella-like endosymbiont of Rhipicephalus sanguineus TaxID=1955402 RepID=UPI00203D890E|nr:NAD(P)H-hydrate epimerase [Coxiella-like endosymbiont of Rhipicephalus sanguineus]